ncbi:MAG: RNase adapter RapZ [Gammaproteobacteria bacterium]|nr:RNase adapter RapZ [Gammaproteobacteria bacterium]
MRLVIVSGRSGSGKSTALAVLEDNDFYCIDNLPASLLPELIERTLLSSELAPARLAVSIDGRNQPQQLEQIPQLLDYLRDRHISFDVVFLDADDTTLLKRFSETRRRHPLTRNERSLSEALAYERELLHHLINAADLHIDTTRLNLYQLGDLIKQRLLDKPASGTAFLFKSFGFKRGLPVEADFVLDVRNLPNPYWQPELRPYSGLEQPVIDFLDQQAEVQELFDDLFHYLQKWLPRVGASNRAYVTIAIGCTGGQHRSVYMVERLAAALQPGLGNIQVRHRDARSQVTS